MSAEVALLLHDKADLLPVRVVMATVPRNGDEVSFDGVLYVVTNIRHLVGRVNILVDSTEAVVRAHKERPVQVEVTAWRRT